jgi:L-2-hydroxyglutarate oxidase LhgO
MPYDVDVIIIGAGIIGLAVASRIAREGREVYILEKNESFGRESSSRNSGTIHSSVLSPRGSLNAQLCVEGRHLIYELCQKYGIDCLRCGKLLVAEDDLQIAGLEDAYKRKDDGIQMQWLSREQMQNLEPEVRGEFGVLLPEAGVVDLYGLMRCYLGLAREKGAQLVCKSEVIGVEKTAEGYRIKIRDSSGISTLQTRIVINCAGQQSDRICALAGIDIAEEGYKLSYFKGEYYNVNPAKGRRMNRRLVYPMLRQGRLMGTHTVLDIDGRVRLGPYFYQVEEINYAMDDSRKQIFCDAIKRIFPLVECDDIGPESAGVMPRLYGTNEKFREFIIRHEMDKGLPGFISVIGIETPGVTASPAIARYVGDILEDILKN